jgi:hypothetical protein
MQSVLSTICGGQDELTADRELRLQLVVVLAEKRKRASYKTGRYRSSSHFVSCTRYSSHSLRFSST